MQRSSMWLGAIWWSLAGTACQPAPAQLSQADRDGIQAVTDNFLAYFKAKNWDGVSGLYLEDGAIMPPNQPAVQGRAAIRDFVAAFPPLSAFSIVNQTIDGRGDLAYVRGTYSMTLDMAGNPTDRGKFVEIRRKGPDGVWRFAVDMFSSDVPPAPPAAPPRRR